MSVTFDVYRIAEDGQRELVQTTQSAREARETRDASPGEVLIYVHDDAAAEDQRHERMTQAEAQGDIEGDYPI